MNTNPKSLKTTEVLIRERCSINFKLTEWVKVVLIHPARLEEVDVLSGNLTASFLYIKIPPWNITNINTLFTFTHGKNSSDK